MTTIAVISSTFLLNYSNYKRYYISLFAIQTVDFNILSHILPTKLSSLLISNNKQEIDKVINSNYGLFGIVITDCKTDKMSCPEQNILFSTKSWYQQYHLENLIDKHFDVLRNPPPLLTKQFYPRISSKKTELTGQNNQGEIIGRVYYIRREFPSFLTTQLAWVKNPFSTKDVKLLYTLTLGVIGLIGILFYFILERIEINNLLKEAKYKQQLELTKNKQLEAENQLLEENQKRMEAENQLLRLQTFASVFNHVVDQEFASVVGNQTQVLQKICQDLLSKIENDARNIIHDIKKAPCLREENFVDQNYEEIMNQFKNNDNLGLLLCNKLDKSIKIIDGVVQELSEITDPISQKVNVSLVLQELQNKLPPSIIDIPNININFYNIEKPIFILANSWHLKSIVRNALYNSANALEDYYYDLEESDSFIPTIDIYLQETVNSIDIIIRDNGLGISENLLNTLYQSSERLNKSAGELKGNGSIIIFAYLTLHKGKVLVQNLATGGAEIIFSFPKIAVN